MPHFFYTKKSCEEIFTELGSGPNGLTNFEAKNRLKEHGRNEVEIRRKGVFDIFWRQIKNAMIFLLFGAVVISLLLKEWPDAIIISIILFINISLGFYQEYKSEKILKKLKKYLVPKTRVWRDGEIEIIDRRDLVIGDVVILESGDIIPADLRLFRLNNFSVNESILTGESVPVRKNIEIQDKEIAQIYEAENLVFSGTLVVEGSAEGIVIAAGKNALMGEIISLTAATKRKSLFEENMSKLSKFILKTVFITLSIIFIFNVLIKQGAIDVKELLLFTIALAISVVPEALPLITSLTFSNGALRMAKKHVVVKRLSAIQDLGSVDVICTDKTGTITENVLIIKNIFPAENQFDWLKFALLASGLLEKRKRSEITEPFEKAIYQKASPEIQKEILNYTRLWHLPFDPARRRNLAVVRRDQNQWLVARGAPEEIINLATKINIRGEIKDFRPDEKEKELKKIAEVGLAGQRVLVIAYRTIEAKNTYSIEDEKDLIYSGFATFSDPIKPTAKVAVRQAQELGIAIKIVTGDSREVAEVVAREIGLPDTRKRVFIGAELDKMSQEEFLKAIDEGVVFARVSPAQKYKIIKALEDKYSVAFLGEGINDAPALKLTHVAMVVDSGADISKEVADIVLLKKDLKVIVDGIIEGRKTFANVIKYIKYTLISNFGNFYAMAAISLFIPFLPMLAVQILLLNLLSDMPLIAVATDKVNLREISRPQKYNFHELTFICIFLGLISSFFDFIFFALFVRLGPEILRTLWFIGSILTELVVIYTIRTKFFFLKGGLPSWTLIGFGFFAALLAIIIPYSNLGPIFHFVKPTIQNIIIIIGLTICYFATTEAVKVIYYRKRID